MLEALRHEAGRIAEGYKDSVRDRVTRIPAVSRWLERYRIESLPNPIGSLPRETRLTVIYGDQAAAARAANALRVWSQVSGVPISPAQWGYMMDARYQTGYESDSSRKLRKANQDKSVNRN